MKDAVPSAVTTGAQALRSATDAIDSTVAQLITAEQLDGLRAGLAAYRLIRERSG